MKKPKKQTKKQKAINMREVLLTQAGILAVTAMSGNEDQVRRALAGKPSDLLVLADEQLTVDGYTIGQAAVQFVQAVKEARKK